MRFLIVDDSKAMQSIVYRAMINSGYQDHEYDYAFDGVEALKKIELTTPDLVLCDWHMPNMNGLELLKNLNKGPFLPPIGFITTERAKEQIQEAKENGALFVVAKPFTAEKLREAVNEALLEVDKRMEAAKATAATNLNSDDTKDEKTPRSHDARLDSPNKFSVAETFSSFAQHRLICSQIRENVPMDAFPMFFSLLRPSSTSKTCVFLVFDLQLANILGASNNMKEQHESIAAIKQKTVSSDCMYSCKLLTLKISKLFRHANTRIQVSAFHLAQDSSERVCKIMQDKNNNVASYRIEIEGYGEGFFHIVFK